MRQLFCSLACTLLLTACGTLPSMTTSEDQRFEAHANAVLEEMWREFPESATRAGNYKYIDRLTVPTQARRDASVAFYERQLAALASFDAAKLNAGHRVDLTLMRNHFESSRWYLTTFRAWEWQPSNYNVGNGFGVLLNTPFSPLDDRLKLMLTRMENVPAYYAAAKASIANPTLEHTQLAIQQNKGALGVFNDDLLKKLDASALSATEKAQFKARMDAAKQAITDHLAWLAALETKLKAGPARSFRIGRALYEQKFTHDIQSGFTAEQLYRRALADKAALHDSMEKLARMLWPKYMAGQPLPADRLVMIRAVIDELSKRHTTREAFVETIRKQIPELESFVREKDLLDQDATRPLVVRETPMYMRGGGAGASISAPGPFDPTANTYYNVTPLDGMSDEDAESYLREYNDWTLQILNIHEAIPGHYTQLMHSNKSKSLIKSLFGNGSMIEGWAVFSEKVMLDAGYGNQSPEIWLLWMKWNLRSVMNTILDYEIQTMNLQRDAALTLMTREAFQQQKEATEKWRRATFTQVQLTSYFNGYAEITALRDELRAKQGKDFSVKGFNNKFLSYGSAPVKAIRELMVAGQ
ncbi:MAG: DUF885 domain-containing protein [Betaproteobacteria bacterium]|nr:DUF885 domain-containing protein [Betaproteobacteria bacterium]